MSTLNFFRSQFTDADLQRKLVFATIDGEIGAGFHITELKHSDVQSIDCSAQQFSWTEATLQILDGYGEDHMKVGKFTAIVDQSLKALPELGDSPLSIEFGPGNQGLGLYQIGAVQRTDTKLIVGLQHKTAMCRPTVRFPERAASSIQVPKVTSCC